MDKQPEPWLRGPLNGIPALLQPAAFALMQSREDVSTILAHFTHENLWVKPSGRASVGFHLQHMAGVLDRMLTYAQAKKLSQKQLGVLSLEETDHPRITLKNLIENYEAEVEKMIRYFMSVDEKTLTDTRTVGRKALPSTVIGILFHAAEHVQRHTGQLLVTASVLDHLSDLS